jgi:hypothetical protein
VGSEIRQLNEPLALHDRCYGVMHARSSCYFTPILQADYLELCEIVGRSSDKLLTSLLRT